jgi:hypothetical protein
MNLLSHKRLCSYFFLNYHTSGKKANIFICKIQFLNNKFGDILEKTVGFFAFIGIPAHTYYHSSACIRRYFTVIRAAITAHIHQVVKLCAFTGWTPIVLKSGYFFCNPCLEMSFYITHFV